MSLIETEIAKLRARAHQVVQGLRQQLNWLEENVQAQRWEELLEIERFRLEQLEGDMRLDRRCARILALHQPVASDLRFVLAVMRMHFYLDEIGERLPTIGRRLAFAMPILASQKSLDLPLPQLITSVRQLLESCLDAFFQNDTSRAKEIDREDRIVDETYQMCLDKVKRAIAAPLSPREAEAWIEMAITLKMLEKIADYAVDIADASIYYAEGVYYWHRYARRSNTSS